MDSSELNKLAGAFLGVVFVVMSVALLSDVIFHTETPEEFGYAIEAVEAEHGGSGEEAVETVPVATLLASADAAAGEGSFKKCAACHTIEEGGANKVGPNLWGIVNRPVASHEGFSYSSAMQEFSEGGAVAWDFEHLNGFLASPKAYVKGTSMGFVGLKKDDERANVIAYLREQAASPAPLPEPEAPEAAASGEADPAVPAAEGASEESPAAEGEAPTETDKEAGATTDTPSAADPAAAEQPAEAQPGASPSAADPLPTPADNSVAAPAGEAPAETQPDPVEPAPVEAAPAETVPAEPAPAQ